MPSRMQLGPPKFQSTVSVVVTGTKPFCVFRDDSVNYFSNFFPPQPWKILNLKSCTFEVEKHCTVFIRHCNNALCHFDVAR